MLTLRGAEGKILTHICLFFGLVLPIPSLIPNLAGLDVATSLDLADILSTLQTVRECVAGMGDKDARRAIGVWVASESVVRDWEGADG